MAASSREVRKTEIDRQTTTPFHLKLFYRQHSFHHLSDFPIPSPSSGKPGSGPNASVSLSLPAHLEIYTWPSCTLRELSHLLTSTLPGLLPSPVVGSRLCFRLIYPDTRGAAADGRGRYLSKEIGSVIIGHSDGKSHRGSSSHNQNGNGIGPGRRLQAQGDDTEKTLADARFVIGDYIDCAVLAPLEDGTVAPPLFGRGTGPSSALGGGMRAFGGPPPRDNPHGRGPRGGGPPPRSGNGIPSGDWRRGERLPDTSGGWGGGRRRGPY
jgi:histone deacetylase complex subunit SAP18